MSWLTWFEDQNAICAAIELEGVPELRRLLNEYQGTIPAKGLSALKDMALSHSISFTRPECVRFLFEAGADMDGDDMRMHVRLFYSHSFLDQPPVFPEGDCILLLDLLMYNRPTLLEAAISCNSRETNREYLLRGLQNTLENGVEVHPRRRIEFEGMLALMEGRYWQEYGGRNPFLDAFTAQEMVDLLMDGAANNERGQTDMTRLRAVTPALRRNVMALLGQQIDEYKSLAMLDVAVANNKGHGPITILCGKEGHIFPIIADYLGVRGRPIKNVRNALEKFNELVTG